MAEGPSGLTCGVWIPRGACQKVPEKYQPTADEIQKARSKIAMLASEENKDDQEMDSEGEEELSNKDVEVDEEVEEIEEEEDEDDEYDGPMLDVPVQGADGVQDIESDDESEQEDLHIKSDDLVFMCTHQRQGGSSALEVYIYDDEQDNIYLHHDIALPAIPLSVAWSSTGPGKDGAAVEDGSYAAVTTFLPFIEVWNLDVLDAPDPVVTLGGCKRESDNYRAKTLSPSMLKKSSHKDAVLCAKWNTEVKRVLASGSADLTVKLWDMVTGENLHTFKQHQAPVQCLQWFKQNPQALMTGSFDQTAKVIDCRTQKAQSSMNIGGTPECIAVSPFDETKVWISLESGELKQFDLRNQGAAMWSVQAHEGEANIAVNPAVNGLVATAGADANVKLWDVRGDSPVGISSRNLGQGRVFSLQFSQDKPTYLLGSGDEGKPLVYCVTDDVSSVFRNH
eukprot:TRINITY_DN30295_c0_g1_i1.p1 TRINITY_DN30295_c0_g1~~TRINITY_DN30295_c0_g1_i1.p1  ORF type:complete len:451 (+),score=92.70 TRINITY_DN30295_c0_g1_i1:40-1392(+)